MIFIDDFQMLSTKRLCKQCSKNVCRGLQPWFTIAEGRIKPGWVRLPVRQFLTEGQAKPLRPTKGKSSKNEVKQFVDYKQVGLGHFEWCRWRPGRGNKIPWT